MTVADRDLLCDDAVRPPELAVCPVVLFKAVFVQAPLALASARPCVVVKRSNCSRGTTHWPSSLVRCIGFTQGWFLYIRPAAPLNMSFYSQVRIRRRRRRRRRRRGYVCAAAQQVTAVH